MDKNGEEPSSINYVDKSIAETKLYVQEEIKETRKQLNKTFGLIAIVITILAGLGIIGVFQNFLGSIVKEKISEFSIDTYLDEININKNNSLAWSEEIKGYLNQARINSKEIDQSLFKSPQIIDFYETNAEVKVNKSERWIQVPFFDDNTSTIEIGVTDSSNVFLVTYAYRVKDKTNMKKWSGIRVSNYLNKRVKLYHTDGGFSNSLEYGSSGVILIKNLDKGSYNVSLEDFSENTSERIFYFDRQFAIYRLY